MKKKKIFIINLAIIFSLIVSNLVSMTIEKEIFFSAYLKGINLADASGKIKIKSNKLHINFSAKTVGVFSIFSNWTQSINVEAEFNNDNLRSNKYKSHDSRGKKKGHMHLDFQGIYPIIVSAQPDPREDQRRKKINKNLLIEANDPIVGVINLGLNQICDKKEVIFDGKRRYILSSKFLNNEIIKKNDFYTENINAIKCAFNIKKLEGYTEKEKKRYPENGYIWFKKIENNLYFPAKIEIYTRWGNFLCLIKEKEFKNESDSL